MNKTTHTKGKEGEEEAIKYLLSVGYKILDKNWRFSRNEIDIIAQKDDIISFVEVKFRENEDYGSPVDSVNLKKRKIIVEIADRYMENIENDLEVQFDIIGITNGKDGKDIQHFPDAFQAFEI